MNTMISFNIQNNDNAEELVKECERIIKETEDTFSRHLGGSEVSAFNDSEKGISVSAEFHSLTAKCYDISENTNGAFDITCAPLTELWNVTSENPGVPSVDLIETAKKHVGFKKLYLQEQFIGKEEKNVKLDMGGVAKGLALEKVIKHLENGGIEYGTVSFGGNIGVIGEKNDGSKWNIGIKNPRNTSEIIGTLKIDSGFVSVSGDYERYFEENGVRYHHIIDPNTGYPVNNGVQCVAVHCNDAPLADALSTACFVMGFEETTRLYNSGVYNFEAIFVTNEGIRLTSGIGENFKTD